MPPSGSVDAVSVVSTSWAIHDYKNVGHVDFIQVFFSVQKLEVNVCQGGMNMWGLRLEMLRFPCQWQREAKGSI